MCTIVNILLHVIVVKAKIDQCTKPIHHPTTTEDTKVMEKLTRCATIIIIIIIIVFVTTREVQQLPITIRIHIKGQFGH